VRGTPSKAALHTLAG